MRYLLFSLFIFSNIPLFPKEPTICLVMIVKNQEEFLPDTLRKIEGFVDCAYFIDTGSTDWTICAVEEWLKQAQIPGAIVDYHDRMGPLPTALINEARTFLLNLPFSLEETYFFLLDADMSVDFLSKIDKHSLVGDAYLVLENSSIIGRSIYEPHLLRASLPWTSTDPLHYNWASEISPNFLRLNQMQIYGGDRRVRWQMEKLAQNLDVEPKEDHSLLRFADLLKNQNKFEEAISLYQRRIELDGDEEEIWFCKMMIGSCWEKLTNWEKALHHYLEAFQMRPQYPDPIQKIATHYRIAENNDLAYLFAVRGALISPSLDRWFFDCPPFQDYQFAEEISISAYYTRYRNLGFEAACKLNLTYNVPASVREQNYRNLLFYAPLLKNTKFKKLNFDLPLVAEGNDELYYPTSLSIAKTLDGYKLICGVVNYTTKENQYQTNDPKGVFRTRNFLLQTDLKFDLISQHEIRENLPRERFPAFNIEGFEECRLFSYQGSDWFSCNTSNTNNTGCYQVSLCKLSKDLSNETVEVERLIPLPNPDPHRNEKNWLPFFCEGDLKFITSYNPLIFFSYALETAASNAVIAPKPSLDFSHFKGSSPPIYFEGGYLALVHSTAHLANGVRAHIHYFLYFDCNLKIDKISQPFVFQHQGIERCHSMCSSHSGEEIILPVEIEERETYLYSIDKETVRSLLIPIANYL